MADDYAPPYLTYTTPTEVISAAAQVQLLALLDVLIAALEPTAGSNSPSPHFGKLSKGMGTLIAGELRGLKVAIDAAPAA